ncbi:MAG: histidine phosphatase family protein [Alphaproteobacteria bacterium]|nr:MAG: histidine phosphatase family protein [Alphaproteobacteria bacterium]
MNEASSQFLRWIAISPRGWETLPMMNSFKLLLIAALAALAAVPALAQPTVYVMRHLEKAEGNDPALSPLGRRNAARLPALLGGARPGAIYVSATRRARETAQPLAISLGLSPKTYDPRDTPALIARVRAETGTVLIVGHSNTVPEIVAALGGARPADIPETQFGDLWRVAPDGRTTRSRIDQSPPE